MRSRALRMSPPSAAATATRFGRGQLRALGRALADARHARGWSLKQLAQASKVSVGAIQRIESGEASASLLTVASLAEALGTSTDRLVRASRAASETRRVVHAKIPKRLLEAFDVTGELDRPHMRAQVVTLAPRATLEVSNKRGALFAYLIGGRLRLTSAAGAIDELAAGDAIHWSVPERMTWFNPLNRPMLALCVVDQRHEGS